MKTAQMLFLTIISIAITSCTSTKNDQLYNTTWQLEYISGPRIAFDGLYPNKKPQLIFNEGTKKVEGNSGCNGYSTNFTINGNTISFGEPGPTTLMYCGEGEGVFLKTIEKINNFNIDADGKLHLMLDDVSMMRFYKVE